MFDPTLPIENTEIDAAQMRSQLNGLKALIDAVPTVTAAQIDAVTTLPASDAANVIGTTFHLTFGIPQGPEGPAGGGLTLSKLEAAIATTPNNTNNVTPLAFSVSEPVSWYERQQIADKINELIGALYWP
jgi:hypothetical protein